MVLVFCNEGSQLVCLARHCSDASARRFGFAQVNLKPGLGLSKTFCEHSRWSVFKSAPQVALEVGPSATCITPVQI
jgi:hypothetical protein